MTFARTESCFPCEKQPFVRTASRSLQGLQCGGQKGNSNFHPVGLCCCQFVPNQNYFQANHHHPNTHISPGVPPPKHTHTGQEEGILLSFLICFDQMQKSTFSVLLSIDLGRWKSTLYPLYGVKHDLLWAAGSEILGSGQELRGQSF